MPPMLRKRPPPPISGFDALVEKHVREAQAQGQFDNLPGAGAPLKLDDDAMMPEELRSAYRILKNSGYMPPEVEALRDLREVELMLDHARDEAERNILIGKFNVLLARAGAMRERNFAVDGDYFQKLAEKLAARLRT